MLYKANLRKSLVHNLPKESRVLGLIWEGNDAGFWDLTVVLQGMDGRMLERRGFAVVPVDCPVDVNALELLISIGVVQHPSLHTALAVFDLGRIAKDETLDLIAADMVAPTWPGIGSHEWPTSADGLTRAFRIEGTKR